MHGRLFIALLCGFAMLKQTQAQQVFVPRDEGAAPPVYPKKEAAAQSKSTVTPPPAQKFPKAQAVLPISSKAATTIQPVKQTNLATIVASPVLPRPITLHAVPTKAPAPRSSPGIPPARSMRLTRVPPPAPERHVLLQEQPSSTQLLNTPVQTAFTTLADGFDFPVGKPDAQGYYKARGFRSHGHLGEDWDGIRGGDTDLGDPIYSIGNGIVVFARDCHMGWGNVVIVRHAYREGGQVKNIDSLYGHLDRILVRRGERVSRGEKIGTMGTAHGLYDAHLHLEVRKNLEIGMSRAAFARDYSNYYDPTQFITAHRHLQAGGSYRVAMNTFIHDSKINFNAARNYSHSHRGGTRESAAALKRAMAAKDSGVVKR